MHLSGHEHEILYQLKFCDKLFDSNIFVTCELMYFNTVDEAKGVEVGVCDVIWKWCNIFDMRSCFKDWKWQQKYRF